VNTSSDEPMPEDERMRMAASLAKDAASRAARELEVDTLPLPPQGLPALRGTDDAKVLGYEIATVSVRDCFGPDGKKRVPGDVGFLDAHMARLSRRPLPNGWQIVERQAEMLLAVVDGNPILLEESARSLGYQRAMATKPNRLQLCELDSDVPEQIHRPRGG
jgi:hypothetical protein